MNPLLSLFFLALFFTLFSRSCQDCRLFPEPPGTCWGEAGVTHHEQESLPSGTKRILKEKKDCQPRPCPSWEAGTDTRQLFGGMVVRESSRRASSNSKVHVLLVSREAPRQGPLHLPLGSQQNQRLLCVWMSPRYFRWTEVIRGPGGNLVTIFLSFKRSRELEEFRKFLL